MRRLCLDTSAYSQFRRNHRATAQAMDTADWIGVPSVVLGELWAGFARGTRAEWNERALASFLTSGAVEILLVDDAVARLYAQIFNSLREAGTPVPINDIWVAACAARHGAAVLTCDAHFGAIKYVASIILPAVT